MRELRRLPETLGAAGVLGLGVLVSCAVFYLTAVRLAERELEAQRAAEVRLKSRSPYQPVSATNSAEAELLRFQNLFPAVERLPDELENLYAVARNAKLELQQGEYRLESRGQGLTAYRVTLPVRGTYSQIREFIGSVLEDLPIVSVDALRFERKKVGDAQIEAQVRLTIHFRPLAAGESQ